MEQVKQIPTELDAEFAILCCLFIDQNAIIQTSDLVIPDDFYDIRNRIIYETILGLFRAGKGIDMTTIVAELKANNKYNEAGGIEYLEKIAGYMYSTDSLDTYIDMVTAASTKRRAINVLQGLAQEGYNRDISVTDYLNKVGSDVLSLSRDGRNVAYQTAEVVMRKVSDMIELNAANTSQVIGMDTGYNELNKYTQGFQGGQLIILAARPAMGKSAYAMNLAINACKRGKSCVIFSLEMSSEQVAQRMLACEASVSLKKIINGQMDDDEWIRIQTAMSAIQSYKLIFDDASDSTIASIRAKCRKIKNDSGLDFVVIDYLQLLEYDNQSRNLQTIEKVTKITRSLKLLARELNIPVVALSQLSRSVEKRDDKEPIMSDLRDSGSIEQDADIVILLYREDYYLKEKSTRKGEADVIIGKNRSGSTGKIPYIFTGEYQSFREKDRD